MTEHAHYVNCPPNYKVREFPVLNNKKLYCTEGPGFRGPLRTERGSAVHDAVAHWRTSEAKEVC